MKVLICFFYNLIMKPILLLGNFVYSVIYRYTGASTKALLTLILITIVILVVGFIRIVEIKKGVKESKSKVINNLRSISELKGNLFIMIALSFFMGLYIPVNTIQVSSLEFYSNHRTPLGLLFNTFIIYLGLFVIWFNLLYLVSPIVLRGLETCFFTTYLINGIINYYMYNTKNGLISPLLVYDKTPYINSISKIAGIIIFLVIFIVNYLLLSKISKNSAKNKTIKNTGLFIALIFAAMSITCIVNITNETSRADIAINQEKKDYEQILPLSTEGQNVVVIMLDKAVTGYIPYIMEDKPYLKDKFDGFTYYPNTVSFGMFTDLATPALYGGYEYTPVNINKRDTETLAEKHNEALTVMPLLFSQHGFTATTCDPSYAGYKLNPDISIYDNYPEINAYITNGVYLSKLEKGGIEYYESQQQDAFFWYSIYRTATPSLQSLIYNGGSYNSLKSNDYLSQPFVERYSVLQGLNSLTEIKNDSSNNYIMLQNETTHEPAHISIDECEDLKIADDVDYNNMNKIVDGETLEFYDVHTYDFYVTNMASYIALGNWFDYLREQGVYDNTRIIIVSDHGNDLAQFKDRVFTNGMDMERYSAVLMVKDFDATGFNISDEFMTVGDVPTLSTEGVIDNPVNPFTGNKINSDGKTSGEVIVSTTRKIGQGIGDYNIKQFDFSDSELWRINGGDIYDEDNWEKVEY